MKRAVMLAGALFAAVVGAGGATAEEPGKTYRIGFLRHMPAELDPYREVFLDGLREFGYVDGKNIIIEYRYTSGRQDLLDRYAAELARLPVHIIVAHGTPGLGAATRATQTVPIVMAAVGDPVRSGFVASLARPGGNVTGVSIFSADLVGKRLELLRDAVPGAATVGLLYHPQNPFHGPMLADTEAAAKRVGLVVNRFAAIPREGFDKPFAAMVKEGVDSLVILDDGEYMAHRRTIIGMAMERHLPTVAGLTDFAEAGALLTYSVDLSSNFRRVGYFIDRILKGANPGDLPVEQTSKIALAINLATAKALGIEIPQALLARADEVIE